MKITEIKGFKDFNFIIYFIKSGVWTISSTFVNYLVKLKFIFSKLNSTQKLSVSLKKFEIYYSKLFKCVHA